MVSNSPAPIPPPADILPHSGDALYIARIVAWNDETTVCESTVMVDQLRATFGTLGIEVMAQAAGLLWAAAGLRNGKPESGMLIAVRDLRLDWSMASFSRVFARATRESANETTLVAEASLTNESGDMKFMNARITLFSDFGANDG